jgi:hypothetical protein
MRVPWDKIGNVAQISVAIIAFVSLSFTAYQGRKTAELINRASDAFQTISYPLVKFSDYGWTFDATEGKLGCDNPAIGLNIAYHNFSGVPVAIGKPSIKVAMAERPIDITAEMSVGGAGEYILPANQSSVIFTTASKEFPDIYKRLRGRSKPPPYFNFTLIIVYHSLITGKRYQYTGKITLLDDCQVPDRRDSLGDEENIVELPPR